MAAPGGCTATGGKAGVARGVSRMSALAMHQLVRKAHRLVPQSLRPRLIRFDFVTKIIPSELKYEEEIKYWQEQWSKGNFNNHYYEQVMLALAHEPNQEFLVRREDRQGVESASLSQ
jgi:hypothetical protein